MENKLNIDFYSLKIVEFLTGRIETVAIYIYGSILTSHFNDDSDIDIAIITEKKMNPVNLYEICSELSFITKRDIHLVDFLEISDVLRIKILKNSKLIFNSNENRRLYHEMNALTSYEKLNEEREIVIKEKYGEDAWKSL